MDVIPMNINMYTLPYKHLREDALVELKIDEVNDTLSTSMSPTTRKKYWCRWLFLKLIRKKTHMLSWDLQSEGFRSNQLSFRATIVYYLCSFQTWKPQAITRRHNPDVHNESSVSQRESDYAANSIWTWSRRLLCWSEILGAKDWKGKRGRNARLPWHSSQVFFSACLYTRVSACTIRW